MSEELKPCPFCGGLLDDENELFCYSPEFRERNNLTIQWWRECDNCHAATSGETPEEAGANWNNRPIEDKLRDERDIWTLRANGFQEVVAENAKLRIKIDMLEQLANEKGEERWIGAAKENENAKLRGLLKEWVDTVDPLEIVDLVKRTIEVLK